MLIKGSYEDTIYIVIGILWIAYSIYKGTQKSRARSEKKNATKQVKKGKSVFETFLDDILVEEKPATITPYEENSVTQQAGAGSEITEMNDKIVVEDLKQEKIFSYDDYYEEGNLQEAEDVMDKDSNVTELKDKEIKIATLQKGKKPRFDLRRAVVYSEILNRRYF